MTTYSDVTYHHRIGDVHLCLIRGAFVRFAAQELEVLAAGSILELLDVGIIAERCQSLPVRSLLGLWRWRTFEDQTDSTRFGHSQ